MAASESPPDVSVQVPAQQDPNSSGGDVQTSDNSASSTSPDNSGSNTGSGTDTSGAGTTDTSGAGITDTTHQGTNTGNKLTPDLTPSTTDTPSAKPKVSPHTGTTHNGGGAADLRRACENAGRIWVKESSGSYCGGDKPVYKTSDLGQIAQDLLDLVNNFRELRNLPGLPDIPVTWVLLCSAAPSPIQCLHENDPSLFEGTGGQMNG
ncbi:hypothetical protein [Streptomyces mirabilis]|uniref:hypothetical protein n=1 Tax=Streptomyces mirabilis TaxID=68239 RepID=UPI00225A3E2D|nr:hypothetical protein [Streptomyces mirabilis]MCX4429604.1 MSCRAMM family adhesin SdrC [Streptomyces mirabilis]